VSAGRLQQANSLLSLSQSATSIFGPAASGAIVAAAGPGWVFVIDAASFLVSVGFVAAMRVQAYVRSPAQRFLHDLVDGWREVRRHRWLTAGFLGFALGNVGIGVYVVLGSVVARDHLGGAEAWGLILMSGSIGGVLGGLVAYRIRPHRPVAAAFAIWPASAMLPFALVGPLSLPLVMVAAGVTFAAILVGNALWETAMQQEVRANRLARVASIDLLLSVCLMPAGAVLAGPVSTAVGTPETLALSGALMCVPNLLVLAFVREVRTLQRREEAPPAPVPVG
jgi:hypothetical protein